MKKNLSFVTSILMVCIVSFSLSAALSPEGGTIIIQPGNQSSTTIPNRTPALIPISAYLDGFTSTVFVSFSDDLGDVDTEITNLYTGETQCEVVDAYYSTVAIPITGEAGLYSIVFTLSSGSEFIGEFEISGEQ